MKQNFAAITFLMMSFTAVADYCAESKVIEHNLEPGDLAELQMKALAGSLEIAASEDDRIHFRGKACTSQPEYLAQMDVNVGRKDDSLILETVIPYHQDSFDPAYASIDIELRVPGTLPLRVQDSSGDMLIEDVRVLSVDDSSGDIRLMNTNADVTIRDSSGEISIREHAGNLRIYDSSGAIDIRDVQGDVTIPGDSSGDIEIEDVQGLVTVESDSSGDIEIEHVTGDVLVGRDGSGSIEIGNINGRVEIMSDGSGSVDVTEISGDFSVMNKGSGEIRHRGVQGQVSLPR